MNMTEYRVKVLIIDEDTDFLAEAATELSRHFTVYTSATGGDGLKLFEQLRPQVVMVAAGIPDTPLTKLLDNLKGLDGSALRIATSHDYSAIEKVVQAIDTGHIHKYFRKPVNYFDLVESINARTVSYQVGRGMLHAADIKPAYARLHNIVEKAKDVENLQQQLEVQLGKVRDVEAESFNKMKDALGEVDRFRKKMADKDALISSLQTKSQELEDLKKRDIDRVERERAALEKELQAVRTENSELRESVPRERKMMTEEMAQQRRLAEEELVRKKDEAERIIEVQKERNKDELQALQNAFEEEKQNAAREILRLKAEFEKDRQANVNRPRLTWKSSGGAMRLKKPLWKKAWWRKNSVPPRRLRSSRPSLKRNARRRWPKSKPTASGLKKSWRAKRTRLSAS
jgi:hypothetical protein